MSNIPTGLSDGDDDTHLTEAEVDNYVSNNGYLTSEVDGSTTNELQDLSLTGTNLSISDGNNVTFTGWDTNASDDVTDLGSLNDCRGYGGTYFIGEGAGTDYPLGELTDILGIGAYSLVNANSKNVDLSVGIGNFSLYNLSTGNNNLAIGHSAGYGLQTGSGNIFLGNYAGYNETGSNKLYIGSSPLIGGDFSTDEVTINGSLSIKDGTQGANKYLYLMLMEKAHGAVTYLNKIKLCYCLR